MSELAKQLSAGVGIDESTAEKVAEYISMHWDEIAMKVGQAPPAMEHEDVPTDSPEETEGRLDDDEGWVLRQADSC